jgi:hypothetical protein
VGDVVGPQVRVGVTQVSASGKTAASGNVVPLGVVQPGFAADPVPKLPNALAQFGSGAAEAVVTASPVVRPNFPSPNDTVGFSDCRSMPSVGAHPTAQLARLPAFNCVSHIVNFI